MTSLGGMQATGVRLNQAERQHRLAMIVTISGTVVGMASPASRGSAVPQLPSDSNQQAASARVGGVEMHRVLVRMHCVGLPVRATCMPVQQEDSHAECCAVLR